MASPVSIGIDLGHSGYRISYLDQQSQFHVATDEQEVTIPSLLGFKGGNVISGLEAWKNRKRTPVAEGWLYHLNNAEYKFKVGGHTFSYERFFHLAFEKIAQRILPLGNVVTIAVPYNWEAFQIEKLKHFMSNFGLQVIECIPRPLALFFGKFYSHLPQNQLILSFLFGSSSYSMALIRTDQNIRIWGKVGQDSLGLSCYRGLGCWAKNIEDYMADMIIAQTRKDPRYNLDEEQQLCDSVRVAMRQLTRQVPSSINFENLRLPLDFSKVCELGEPLMAEMTASLKSLFDMHRTGFHEINSILLGGAAGSWAPLPLLFEKNNHPPILTCREETVSCGAAWYGAFKQGWVEKPRTLISNVNPQRIASHEIQEVQPLPQQSMPLQKEAFIIYGSRKTPLNKPLFTIGRNLNNDLHFPNVLYVSGQHCKISHSANGWYIIDPGSRNHTFVNNQQLPKNERKLLQNGDVIMLATAIKLIFHQG